LERAGIPITSYTAYEIDKHAIAIAKKNYPDTIHHGDVRECKPSENEYDLVIGGSPCQDLSIAKKGRKGLDGDRSGLFWEWVRVWKAAKPKWWVLENVASMPKKDRDIISKELGVEPVLFNASLVSAQSRKRLFWTNIKFDLPEDRGILLKDILQPDVDETFYIDKMMKANGKTTGKVGYVGEGEQYGQGGQAHRVYSTGGKTPTMSSGPALIKVGHVGGNMQGNRVYSTEGKATTLSAEGGGLAGGTTLILRGRDVILNESSLQVLQEGRTELGKQSRKEIKKETGKDSTSRSGGHKAYFGKDGTKANCLTTALGAEGLIVKQDQIRKLTPIECERLQGLPDNYTEGVAKSHRYKCLGNAFNVDVVAHILGHITRSE
jgi:DNA (cytosine-5)-methyltransferase 3A